MFINDIHGLIKLKLKNKTMPDLLHQTQRRKKLQTVCNNVLSTKCYKSGY